MNEELHHDCLGDCDPDAIDLLAELVNIGVGRAAASLSELTDSRIELNVPMIRLAESTVAQQALPLAEPTPTIVVQDFQGELQGRAALAFPAESGLTLASLLTGVEAVEDGLDVELQGVLLEIGNILLNNVMGVLANEAGIPLTFSIPSVHSGAEACTGLFRGTGPAADELLIADVQFQVRDREICGSVLIVFQYGSVLRLVELVRAVAAATAAK